MKKLLCVSLIKTIAKCIVDLMTLKQKLISANDEAPAPVDLNSDEYFIGNEKCAEHLGISSRTVSRYTSGGLLKSTHSGQFNCYKKSDVAEAVENVPSLKAIYNAKLTGKRAKRVPEMITSCEVSDSFLFIRLTYQGWHCLVCTTAKNEGNQSLVNKLCKEVIRAYHKVKPFRVAPV